MFKLIVSVIVLSSTGSPAIEVRDMAFKSEALCQQLAREMTYTGEKVILGRAFTIQSKARCLEDDPDTAPVPPHEMSVPLPPPFDLFAPR